MLSHPMRRSYHLGLRFEVTCAVLFEKQSSRCSDGSHSAPVKSLLSTSFLRNQERGFVMDERISEHSVPKVSVHDLRSKAAES